MEIFDQVVVGAGVMGAAAAYRLARRAEEAGQDPSVLLLERKAPAHAGGSSHGASRIIRLTYEHADYVRLARESFRAWEDVEREANECLFFRTGDLFFGPRESRIAAYPEALAKAGVPCDVLSTAEAARRFPQFRVGDGDLALTQSESGLLAAERGVLALVRLAERRGVRVRTGTALTAIDRSKDPIVVSTTAGRFGARRLVLAAGAWMRGLVPELHLPLRVVRQEVFFFAPGDAAPYRLDRLPVWVYLSETDATTGDGDFFYGLPIFGGFGLKAARHVRAGTAIDPDEPAGKPSDAAEADVRAFLARRIPGAAAAPCVEATTCLYTVTPDEDFVLDRHPDDARIVLASPCSGHGFKFGAALGGVLADLAWEEGSEPRSEAFQQARGRFSARRFGR